MIQFFLNLKTESFGWADLTISSGKESVICACSWNVDTFGGLACGLASLSQGGPKLQVDCDSEPQETELSLRRVGDELHVAVRRFQWQGDAVTPKLLDRALRSNRSRDWKKARRSRNRKVILRASGPFIVAARSYWYALNDAAAAIGLEKYKHVWNHPYPQDAMDKLRRLF